MKTLERRKTSPNIIKIPRGGKHGRVGTIGLLKPEGRARTTIGKISRRKELINMASMPDRAEEGGLSNGGSPMWGFL